MSTYHLYRAVQLVIVLSARVTHAATDGGVNTESSITTNSLKTYEPFSTTDPMYTVSTVALDTFATASAETVTQDGVSTVTTDLAPSSEATTEPVIETVPPPVETTAKTSLIPKVCLCDLTPDFCDIGCCCDIVDCDIPDLSSVFNGCLDEVIYGECIESWLIFRVNVDPSCVTVTNKFVCIRPEEDNTTVSQILPALANTPLDSSYHFSWKGSATYSTHTKDFYRVDDTIMSHFNSSSIRGVLRQPSPGAATSSCVDRNPARFLRSISLSCTRTLTPLSCATDPSLNAQSYFHDISLFKSPEESCESGCLLPHSLSVQVLWAQTGLLAFPQNYILGAKYLFHCQKVKCPLVSPFAVTTEVMFVDTTVYPEPPRGTPQPKWKFPFDFFSRGIGELDGQTVTTNSSDLKKVTWDIMLVALLLLCWFH
uniref:Tectonic domain-containing protein n=1 Tax=Oncorhynchus mykiss TaxID=8022 RepID=A0A8C7WGX9_ONCMY